MNVYIIYQKKLSFKCLGKIYGYGYIRIVRNILWVFFTKTINNYAQINEHVKILYKDITKFRKCSFTSEAPCCSDGDDMSSCCEKT